jgi:hydroxyacylglutathione hydrolase
VPDDVDLYLLADREEQAREGARLLALIGLERVAGWVDVQVALAAWRAGGRAVEAALGVTVAEAQAQRESRNPVLLDVRAESEWEGGHLPDALHIHLGTLPGRVQEIPRGRPVLVYCRSGARSSIAQSLLLRAGYEDVFNVEGGWTAWSRAGLPTVRPQGAAAD